MRALPPPNANPASQGPLPQYNSAGNIVTIIDATIKRTDAPPALDQTTAAAS